MDNSTGFMLELAGYSAKRLEPEDEEVLQRLYEQCTQFAYLTDGYPPPPSAARDEFFAIPEGKTLQDKFIFGLFDVSNALLGMLEAIRHYPNDESWWVGLMMLAPQQRGKGLGSEFYRAFDHWVAAQGARQVLLSVIEENELGYLFWQKLGFEVTQKLPPTRFGNKIHARYAMKRVVDTIVPTAR